MAGYTRQSEAGIVDGGIISADDLNSEFDQIETAMGGGGHNHDGSAGQGPQIQQAGIATGAIVAAKLGAGAVETAKVNDLAITDAKLAADAVTTNKIINDAVTNAKIADDAITGAKIDSTTTVTAASFIGPIAGAVTGNATTATTLATARNIAGQSFDGSADINIATTDLTDVTATSAEVNILDGDTTALAITLADADRVVVNDAGTMKQVALTDFETYFESALDTLTNVTSVGALDAGSITSGFGAIDNGSSNITTTGTVSYGTLSDGTTSLTATAAELNYVDGVTSLIQTQIDGKQATITGAATTIDDTDLTVSRALESDASGKIVVSAVTSTELNLLDGATAATATTLADADRVIVNDAGTMKQVALSDVKTYVGSAGFAPLAGATFTGDVIIPNLTVNGDTTTLSTTNTLIADNLLELNSGATSNGNDCGIIIERGSTGDNAVFLWDESLDKFALGTTTAVATATGNITYTAANLVVGSLTANGIGVTGSISLDDDDQIIIGTGNDLRIYHDPAGGGQSNVNRIVSSGVGGLKIENSVSSGYIYNYADNHLWATAAGQTQASLNATALVVNNAFKFSGGTSVSAINDEDDMSSDSATALATQQSIKAYVDTQVATVASDSTGSAPVYGARAWGTFDGTDYTGSTVDLTNYSTGNVASISRISAGQYSISFTTALPNANYTFIGTINNGKGDGGENLFYAGTQGTGTVSVYCSREETEAFLDSVKLSFVIFG